MRKNIAVLLGFLFLLPCVGTGCYSLRPSSGGGQTSFDGSRAVNPQDVALPEGYRIEAVATGLTFPTGITFDDQGQIYVVESGYSYGEVWTTPRLLRIGPGGQTTQIAAGGRNGPWTGVTFHDGAFLVAEGGVLEGGRILRITPDGNIRTLVDGLPSGDHHTDGPVVSSDGWVYFGQGTMSNSGVVGEDNAKFGWLKRQPKMHDYPGQDITLVGHDFKTKNVLDPQKKGTVYTGAFSSFGTPTDRNQTVEGRLKCSGAILRVRPDGSDLQLVAWGFRNPFGLAFSPDGGLYATDNGYDERGSRPVWGAPDLLWRVKQGTWYGWPDYSGSEPLTLKKFKPPGKPQPQFLLASHPNRPPEPVVKFGVHASADGLDFSRSDEFGHIGNAFVALLGDESPSTGKTLHPVGYKVVRVDVHRAVVEDFAVNKNPKQNGPASKIGGGGLERPVAVRFNPEGNALYIVDFGVLLEGKSGAKPQVETGVIWKVTRWTAGRSQ